MEISSITKRLWGSTFLCVALFVILSLLFDVADMIVWLNGAFFGTMGAILVTFWTLLTASVTGSRPYDRVSHATIGFFLLWVAYVPTVIVSVYLRAAGFDVQSNYLTAISRCVAIAAAIFQVTTPDFGYGILYGKERKTLWVGVAVGLAITGMTVYAQRDKVLAEAVDPISSPASLERSLKDQSRVP